MSSTEKLNIKQWSEDDRPREKLLARGAEALTDAELLAILMGSGNREETAVDLAKRILASVDNDLNRLGRCSVYELIQQFKGVGEAKAVAILAATELGKRRSRFTTEQRDAITRSSDVYRVMYAELADKPHEEMWILLLNARKQIIAKKRIGQGGVSQVMVDARIVLRETVVHLASSVVLCHNHPSGSVQPSEEDTQLTQRVARLLTEVGSQLVDHIIVGNGYYSFADEGLIGV